MLQIKNLTVTHTKDNRILLENLSFTLNNGDKMAIIGEEGNGKSTLLKLIYDEASVEDYIEYSGEIIRNNMRIGYLAQELTAEEKAMTVYEFMCEMPLFFEASPKELAQLASELKMPSDIFYSEQQMGKLSGGEKIKLQFGRLILNQSEVLLLDEPSNDLDIATINWLERFINESRLPVLYISHDEVLLENTANAIIHIEQIKRKMQSKATVMRIPYLEYMEGRARGLAHQEQVARKERSDFEKQQEKFRQIQQKVEHRQNSISRQDPHGGRLLKKSMHRIKAYEARFEKEFENMTEIPETEDAIFIKFGENASMPNGKIVLDYYLDKLKITESETENSTEENKTIESKAEEKRIKESQIKERLLSENISLRIQGAEKVCIIGRNGCGKTTLLRRIAEELLARKDIKAAYMPQNYEELLDMEQTPVEFLSETGDKDEISRIRTYLGSMKYTPDEMTHKIKALSGGQKAKILLLKMSMSGCNVLILDEPTRNFSPLSNPVIRQMLRGFGGTIISVSHDRRYIEEVIDKVYELTEDGLVLR